MDDNQDRSPPTGNLHAGTTPPVEVRSQFDDSTKFEKTSSDKGGVIDEHKGPAEATSLTPKLISQQKLVLYQRLKPLAEQFRHLVRVLTDDLDGGAVVESGPLTVLMDVTYKKRLLTDYLFRKLGLSAGEIDCLRKEAPELRYRSLIVRQTANPTNPAAKPTNSDEVLPLDESPDWGP